MTILDLILFLIFCWSIFNFYKTRNKLTPIKVEQVIFFYIKEECNQVYLWNSVNDEFIAQGKTLEEALEIGKIRFPNFIFRNKEDETIAK
jgi:hypothetical protein